MTISITDFKVNVCFCSCDDHYQTSEEHCGLDFDLVETSFAKLSENKSLISEVMINLTIIIITNFNNIWDAVNFINFLYLR